MLVYISNIISHVSPQNETHGPRIMGDYTIPTHLKRLGWTATGVMTAVVLAMFVAMV